MLEGFYKGVKEAISDLESPLYKGLKPIEYELRTEPIFPIRLTLTLEEEGKEPRKISLTIERRPNNETR